MNNNFWLLLNDTLTSPGSASGSYGEYGGALVFVNGGSSDTTPAGFWVVGSTFTSPTCDDGVDLNSGGRGVTIGPGNTFTGMTQGSCGNHVDPV